MKKQKIEVFFRMDMECDSKIKVTKAKLRSQLEEGIKGLKITSCNLFEVIEDRIRAEFTSNIPKLLKAEELHTLIINPEEHKITDTVFDSLLLRIRKTMEAYNDEDKRKDMIEVMGNLLHGFESDLVKVYDKVAKVETLQKENNELKLKLNEYKKETHPKDNNAIEKVEVNNKDTKQEDKISALESELLEVISQLRHQEHLYNQLSEDVVKIVEVKVNLERELSDYRPAPIKKGPSIKGELESNTKKKLPVPDIGEALKKELDKLKEEIITKDKRLSYMTSMLSKKEDEIIKCMFDYAQVQDQLKKSLEDLKIARSDIQIVGEQGRVLQNKIANLDEENTKLEVEVTNYKKQIEKDEEKLKKKEEEIEKCLRKIEERNDFLKNNEDKYIEYEKNKQAMEKTILQLKEEVLLLNQRMPNNDGYIDNVLETKSMSLIKDYKEKVNSLEGQLKEKDEKIENLKVEYKKEVSTLISRTETYQKENEELRGEIITLEKKVIDNTPTSSNHSTSELQNIIKELKKTAIEQQHLLTTEQRRMNLEVENQKAIIVSLTKEIENKNKEIRQLEDTSVSNDPKDVGEYIKEIIYLYKTLVTNCNERIEEIKVKIERLKVLEDVKKKMGSKDKVKEVVIGSVSLFPYLEKFNLKSDLKFVTACMLKVIERKLKKLDTYQADCERNEIVLKCSEEKYKEYSNKLSKMK